MQTHIKTFFIFALLTGLFINTTSAQKIYSCDSKYDANIKVYVVDSKYDADLLIYFVDSKYDAGWNNMSKKYLIY